MSFIAILGAGTLGGTLAATLARHDRVRDLRLIDAAPGIAAGKALDIRQAGPVEEFSTRISATTRVDAVVGAKVVVVTGPAETPNTEWQNEPALKLAERVSGLNHRAPIVCAGASHGLLVEQGIARLGIDPAQILGSAPGALVSGLRALIALEAGTSPAEISINLFGVPPAHPVVAWSGASVGGCLLEERLTPTQLARLRAQVEKLWPPGPYALASSAAAVIEAIVDGESRRSFACFVGSRRGSALGATSANVTLGRNGVKSEKPPHLSRLEQVQLENALVQQD